MVYKIDYRGGDVLRWSLADDGAEYAVDDDYAPTLYVSAHGDADLATARRTLREHPAVDRVTVAEERISFRHDPQPVLRVDVADLDAVTTVAHTVRDLQKRARVANV